MAKVLCCFSLSLNAKRTEEVRKIEKKSGTAVAAVVRVRQVKEGTLKKERKTWKLLVYLLLVCTTGHSDGSRANFLVMDKYQMDYTFIYFLFCLYSLDSQVVHPLFMLDFFIFCILHNTFHPFLSLLFHNLIYHYFHTLKC